MRTLNNTTLIPRSRTILAALAALCCGQAAGERTVSLAYTTEWQTDFHKNTNWVNLLAAEASIGLSRKLSADVATISVATTRPESIIPDLLTFSNIEEENIPLALSRLGLTFTGTDWSISAGVGNVNDAFFVTPLTSLFTNSSCGIFPTISCNFPIANYPDAALGIEGCYRHADITLNSALYNGNGHHHFIGSDCVFRIRPATEGIFNINALNYNRNDNNYNLGIGLYHGRDADNETGTQNTSPTPTTPKEKTDIFYWLYAEQKITERLSLMAQISQCPLITSGCRNFYGAGAAYRAHKYEIGIYSCYADFTGDYEWASELTVKYGLSSHIDLQSSIHYIKNTLSQGPVGLFRVNVTF